MGSFSSKIVHDTFQHFDFRLCRGDGADTKAARKSALTTTNFTFHYFVDRRDDA